MENSNAQKLDGLLQSIEASIKALDESTARRQEKYRQSVKAYSSYLKRESRMLESVLVGSERRNQNYVDEIRKAQIRGFGNSRHIIELMKKTNKEKQSIQRYVNRLVEGGLASEIDYAPEGRSFREEASVDLNRYRQIVEQYRSRLG